MLVEMEYLDPADGWASLYHFSNLADPLDVENACTSALHGLQDCLGGTAVHGDLRAPNIFIRWGASGRPTSSSGGGPQGARHHHQVGGLPQLGVSRCEKVHEGIKLSVLCGQVVPQKGAPVAVPPCSGLLASEGEEHELQHR